MKIERPRLPDPALSGFLDRIVTQLNLLSSGSVSAIASATAAPTTGTYAVGDFVRNSTPSEVTPTVATYDTVGTVVGAKYVVFGWVCVTAGTPGTWKECRFLTGN